MDAPPVQYVTTSDGYDIAYSVCGNGPPFVLMPYHGNHMQLMWNMPWKSAWLEGLQERFKLICFDSRGQGMSSRGLPGNFALSDYLRDLETVVDHLNLDHFILAGQAHQGHVAIQYAVAHPDRVQALVLTHCSLLWSIDSKLHELARDDWEHLRTLASGMLPGDRDTTLNFWQQTVTQQDWLALADTGVSDIAGLLPVLHTPTLLLHASGFTGLKREEASKLAARIQGSRLVLTEGSAILIDAAQGLQAIDAFLQNLPAPSQPRPAAGLQAGLLSAREVEVLRLLAQGKSNPEIAEALFITRNTVQNHVSSILIKTNLTNRAQAAVYAKEHNLI